MYFLGLLTRCKDEFYIKEFCDYYLSQGVDKIYIIDDNSNDKSIYYKINDHRVKIIYENNIIKKKYSTTLYKEIKSNFTWMIFCDVDEFITTKKNITNTIRDELNTTFKDVDCVKIPWVMMSCNNKKNNPKSVLFENTYRWNHDKKHGTQEGKFRCRYGKIEVKCIFKPDKFDSLHDHHPQENSKPVITSDSINMEKKKLIKKRLDLYKSTVLKKDNIFYENLREKNIRDGILLCYHYRIISQENSLNKLKRNYWYVAEKYDIKDLMSCDYPEIIDYTLKYKSTRFKYTFYQFLTILFSLKIIILKEKEKDTEAEPEDKVELDPEAIA
jgi:hypothetical protein